ncbi:MAG: hypothetical protein MUF58_02260 [Arcicella sp.]|jgi:hypothetical protein|nr:hypothetical protein [Arcicella sp.]
MNWKIEKTKISERKKGIVLIADCPFDHFFDSYDLFQWSNIIDAAIEEGRCGIEDVLNLFYHNYLDWFDINVTGIIFPEDSVMVRLTLIGKPVEEATMKKKDFEIMLLEFSKTLLEIHRNNHALPNNWGEKMEDRIHRLEGKLSSYS